jgi:hypothetical protein
VSDKFQFVFQGGGAKLGVLIAAAEAIYVQKKANNFSITRISGTSAGAIAACILATGQDPAIFRKQLEVISSQYLDKILNVSNTALQIYKIWQGVPIYKATIYKDFIRALFDLGNRKWDSLQNLDIEIFVHAVDIYTRKEIIYKRDPNITIADALFDSSAIPFIFRTYKDVSSTVDGGLTNNFPSDVLRDDVEKYGPVIGFSFASDVADNGRPDEGRGIWAFGRALISTVIDAAAAKALAKLPKGDVHYFSTATSTLDWQQGLRDLKPPLFNGYFDEAKRFIDDVVTRYRMASPIVTKAEITERIFQLHKGLQDQQGHIKVTRVILTYTCHALRERNPNRADDALYITEIASVSDPVFTFGVRVTVENETIGNDLTISVFDDRDSRVETTVIPISPESLGGEVPDNNFLLFFQQPLVPGRKYRISIAAEAREVMYDLCTQAGRDLVAYFLRNMDEVEEVNVVVLLPESTPRPSIVQGSGPLPMGLKWGTGSPLDDGELSRICPALRGFYPIGWRSRNVVRGVATGFMAVHIGPARDGGESGAIVL